MSFLDSFAEWQDDHEDIPDKPPTEPPKGAVPELMRLMGPARDEKIWELNKCQGYTIGNIARLFGISDSTVKRCIRRYNMAHVTEVREQSGLETVVEEIKRLEEVQRICIEEVRNVQSAGKKVNPKTGKVVDIPAQGEQKDKQNYLKIHNQAGEMKRALMLKVGLIPQEPEKIMHSIDDLTGTKKTEKRDEKIDNDLNAMQEDIAELLRRTKTMG